MYPIGFELKIQESWANKKIQENQQI